MEGGLTPTRHWGTPTRARGSPTKLLRADGTARSHETLPARKASSCALLAARHMALSQRHQSPPSRHQSPPLRHLSLPARHESPSIRHKSLQTEHESRPARRTTLPAQQLVSPARRAQLGFNSASAGVRFAGSGGVQGALLVRQHATGKAARGPGVSAYPPADRQDRLVGNPLGEPSQTGGRAVGGGEEVDQMWRRYLTRAKEKQDLQAGEAASGTAVISSSQVCFDSATCGLLT